MATPLIFNYSQTIKAGDLAFLQGANFGSAATAWMGSTQLPVINRSVVGNSLTVRIPYGSTGAFNVTVVNGADTSAAVCMNAARPDNLDATELVPGGAFRVFGRNLKLSGYTPVVMVGGSAATVNAGASNEHMLVCMAPSGLSATSSTTVTVDNGNGSGAKTLGRTTAIVLHGTGDPFGLGVGWGAGFTGTASRTVNASVVGDGVADDRGAIVAAITAAVGMGGARVVLPAGAVCRISATLDLKSLVILDSDATNRATIVYETNYPIYADSANDFTGMRNIILQRGTGGTYSEGMNINGVQHFMLKNVKINLGTSRQMYLQNNVNVIVDGCVFNQAGGVSEQGPYIWNNCQGFVFTNNTTNWIAGAPNFSHIHDAYVAGNTFTRDVSGQASGSNVVHSFVMDFAYCLSVVGNTFLTTGVVTNKDRNDGEVLLTEGGGNNRTENLGTATSATSTTLTDTTNTFDLDPFDTGVTPENYGIAIIAGTGMGQHRRVLSVSGTTLTISSAWAVTPDTTSKYSTFVWGLEKALLKGNTITRNPRGVWLYQTAVRNVDVLDNVITNGGGIYLRMPQKVADKMALPMFGVRIQGNSVTNSTGEWGSYVVVMFTNIDGLAFGCLGYGVEVRANSLTGNASNVSRQGEEYASEEGYMCMMRSEGGATLNAFEPRLLGTIFDLNNATNLTTKYRLGGGSSAATIKDGSSTNVSAQTTNWDTDPNAPTYQAVDTVIDTSSTPTGNMGTLHLTGDPQDLPTVVGSKATVGLPLVDNTADMSKPVSTAQATAIAAVQATVIRTDSAVVSGLSTSASNNAPAWASIVSAAVAAASATTETYGQPTVHVPAGKYTFTAGIAFPPWVKAAPLGTTQFDFSGAGSTVTAIRSSNESAPSGAVGSKNSGNIGPTINGMSGSLFLKGPGNTTSSYGIDAGNATTVGEYTDYRDVSMANFVVTGFGVGLRIRSVATYLFQLQRARLEGNGTQIVIDGTTGVNSGERLVISDTTLGGNLTTAVGIKHDVDAVDLSFDRSSIDFCYSSAVLLTSNCRFCTIALTNSHLEGSSGAGLIVRQGGSENNVDVFVHNCKIVPTTLSGSAPTNARSDGVSTPYIELFKGYMRLSVDNVTIGGYKKPYYDATKGLFMCDSNVRLQRFTNVNYTDYIQLPARAMIANVGSNFANATTSADPNGAGVPGWTVTAIGNCSAAVATDQAFSPSTKALKITASATGNYFVMESDPFAIEALSKVMACSVAYGGTSTGTLQIQNRTTYYRNAPMASVAVSSYANSAPNLTVTTAVAHGLTAGRWVVLGGLSPAGYNRRYRVDSTPSSTTFTVQNTTGSPTGTLTYTVCPELKVSDSGQIGDNFGTQYADTDFPGYTGTRAWWMRNASIQYASNQVPVGAQWATVEVTVSNLAASDVVWLGETMACVIG